MLRLMNEEEFQELIQKHGVGLHSPANLQQDIQHLVSPIVGTMRMQEVSEDDHTLSRLRLALELARRTAIYEYAVSAGIAYIKALEEERKFWQDYENSRVDKRLV